MKIDLPSGGWVKFREPEEVSDYDRRPILVALQARAMNLPADIDMKDEEQVLKAAEKMVLDDLPGMLNVQDAAIRAIVEEWSYVTKDGEPVRVPLDWPDDMWLRYVTGPDYDKMANEITPLIDKMFGKFSVDDAVDPSSPTQPSSG